MNRIRIAHHLALAVALACVGCVGQATSEDENDELVGLDGSEYVTTVGQDNHRVGEDGDLPLLFNTQPAGTSEGPQPEPWKKKTGPQPEPWLDTDPPPAPSGKKD
jgi:hypothetical protein